MSQCARTAGRPRTRSCASKGLQSTEGFVRRSISRAGENGEKERTWAQMQKWCSNRNGNAVEMAMRYTSRTHLSKGLTMKWLNRTLRDRSYRWTVDTRPSHRDYIGIQAELDPRRA